MPFITVRDLEMYYEIRGTGPRLLSISGTGADLRRSPTIFDQPIAQHFEILAYDQRGLGRTSRPDMPYSMADYAADADALLAAVGWDQCLVIGISFGGMVAQELAVSYPHRVERLTLACTCSGGAGGAAYPLHELGGLTPVEYLHRTLELSDTRRDADWQAAHADEWTRLIEQALVAQQVGRGEPGREMGARRQLDARAGHDTYDRLPQLRMPVFVCGGRYDGIAPPANLEAMAKQIPGARLALFEGGHPFHIQDPTAYPAIIAFLQGIEAGA